MSRRSQDVAVARAAGGGSYARHAALGVDSGWAKEPNIGYRLINARSETAHEKPSFRAAFRHRAA